MLGAAKEALAIGREGAIPPSLGMHGTWRDRIRIAPYLLSYFLFFTTKLQSCLHLWF